MKKSILLLIGTCFISTVTAQNTEYISLGKDQYGNSTYYKIDKTTDNEFFFWFKIEYTMANDPGMSNSEFYINAKCYNKTTAMLKYKNDWRNDDENDGIYEAPRDKIQYVQSTKNDKTYFLFKKYCSK